MRPPHLRAFGPVGRIALALAALLCAAVVATPALAGDGKLLLTGGVTSIDGAAGGGLVPWALTAGYASEGEWGATAAASAVRTGDYAMTVIGIAASFGDRLELSVAQQDFDTRATGAALGLPGLHLRQNIVGAKLRVAGDAVLDSDTWMPAIAIGIEGKRLHAGGLAPTLASLGAARSGVDVFLAASKLFLAQSVLVDATLRVTKANQNGLLGFGSNANRRSSIVPEVSVAWLLHRTVAVGAEYRAKPDKLGPATAGGLREDDWKDVFIAWAPNKHLSLTLAAVDLGRIAPLVQSRRQRGGYLSAQLSY